QYDSPLTLTFSQAIFAFFCFSPPLYGDYHINIHR
ncbi:hypothetical protein, partial [Escherichia coli]